MCLFFYLVIVCILLIFEIYNKKTLKKTRKFFHFFIFLIATLLTPPDIISQLCFSIIFIFIFEILLYISFLPWVFYILYINSYVFKLCLEFFINFQNSNDNSLSFFFEAKFNEYFNFFLLFYKMCLFFYLVIVCILLIFEIYNKKTLKKTRKFFHFFIFLIATLLTPPDIISQLCFSIIFIFIFEILLYISFLNKNW